MDELTESNVLSASNTIPNQTQTHTQHQNQNQNQNQNPIQNQSQAQNDPMHTQISTIHSTHSNHIDIEHNYKESSDLTNDTKTVVSQMPATVTVKSVITANNTSTTVTNTMQPSPVNSSTLPINLSVELRKIQQSAGLITSSSNSTFISKHIYHSADKMQTSSSLTGARIPAPNVTVVDKNGENIRILKRVPDSNFGAHSFESSSSIKSNLSQSARAASINLISANQNQNQTGPANTSIYDQHIRVLTPVEIMRTLPSLHDHEMTSNESTAASNFSTALCRSRRNAITSSHENSKDIVDSTAIDSSAMHSQSKKIDASDDEMTETHINNIIVTSKLDNEVASPIVSSTQMKSTDPQNRNTFATLPQQCSLTHSTTCSSPSSTSNAAAAATAAALTMVRGVKLIENRKCYTNVAITKKIYIFGKSRTICVTF